MSNRRKDNRLQAFSPLTHDDPRLKDKSVDAVDRLIARLLRDGINDLPDFLEKAELVASRAEKAKGDVRPDFGKRLHAEIDRIRSVIESDSDLEKMLCAVLVADRRTANRVRLAVARRADWNLLLGAVNAGILYGQLRQDERVRDAQTRNLGKGRLATDERADEIRRIDRRTNLTTAQKAEKAGVKVRQWGNLKRKFSPGS